MSRNIDTTPPLCKISSVAGRTLLTIEGEKLYPQIDVWWDWAAKHQEVLIIRQEAADKAVNADVLTLSQSQAYALLDALNRALELP